MGLASTGGPQVELRLPADNAYAAVLRMTATGLAARAEFTVDAIEDLRINVGEAIALLIPLAAEGADLKTAFTVRLGRMCVDMSTTPVDETSAIDPSSFAWQVLTALAENCETVRTEGRVHVRFEVVSPNVES